jgi:pimeloyl-ACP methyl ester carboxylesterase
MSELLLVSKAAAAEVRGDVVFVHGLDGGARDTWAFDSAHLHTFWPEWINRDLSSVRVWALGYEAASFSWRGSAMPLTDRALNILDLLTGDDIGSRPLVFVGHSLGGLLVKQLLRTAADSKQSSWSGFCENTRGIVFLATPHTGSAKAGWYDALGWLLRANVTIEDLRNNAPALRDLNNWYRNNAADLGIQTMVYRESRAVRIGPISMMIVDQASSDPGMHGVIPIPLDRDHIDICKLSSREHPYPQILEFIKICVERPSKNQSSQPSETHKARVNRDKYRPAPPLDIIQSALFEELDRVHTTPRRRREIGVALHASDPRPGVNVIEGHPDFYWCFVPASENVELSLTVGSLTSKHRFHLNDYFVSRYPVTCAQFRAFLDSEDGYGNPEWWQGMRGHRKPGVHGHGDANCPQTSVTWREAAAFCAWLNATIPGNALPDSSFEDRWEIRLPYEWEWQHAAIFGSAGKYPWGELWDDCCANTAESRLQRSIAVGMFPRGRVACGAEDMIGNVHEWCGNEYGRLDGVSPLNIAHAQCSVRGGCWETSRAKANAYYRDKTCLIGACSDKIGFRPVCVRPA